MRTKIYDFIVLQLILLNSNQFLFLRAYSDLSSVDNQEGSLRNRVVFWKEGIILLENAMTLEKEKKEKERRKRRKEIQKQKKFFLNSIISI